jgi:hypothetical protein
MNFGDQARKWAGLMHNSDLDMPGDQGAADLRGGGLRIAIDSAAGCKQGLSWCLNVYR